MAKKIARIRTSDGRIARIEVEVPDEKMTFGRALALPELKSRQGLDLLTEKITPSREDIESGKVGIPGIAARTTGETLSEVAPSFVSPLSIIAGGISSGLRVAKPILKTIGKFTGKTLESTSGLVYKTPGVLGEVVEKPSIFFGKGIEKAKEGYKAIFQESNVRPELSNQLLNFRSYIRKAMNYARTTGISPEEALEGRKAVDALKDTPDIIRKTTRNFFDLIAKKKFAEADKAYSQAIKSEAVRSFWAVNKSGTPSIIKGGVTTVLPFTAPLFSPLAQGLGAATLGGAKKLVYPALDTSRKAFRTGVGLGAILDKE